MYRCSRRLQVMFCSRQTWVQLQKQPFCSKHLPGPSAYDESLKKLDKMDFVTAAMILFTEPPKTKKSGLDFHLVQLFFACMPSVAVYLVAQYARYDIRKMEAELERKKKKQEEENAVELELNATEEKEAGPVPELLEVKERLEKLEETVKVIAAGSKKQMAHDEAKGHEGDSTKKSVGPEASTASSSESSKPFNKDPVKQDFIEPRQAAGKDS